jgi:hypothetical protein
MSRPAPAGWWRRLGRAWLSLAVQSAWSILAWIELSLTLVALICSAIVFGAYLLRALLAVDRATLRMAIRLARWSRADQPGPAPAPTVGSGQAVVWLASAAIALAPHVVCLALFPRAAWWGPLWTAWTIRMGRPQRSAAAPDRPEPASPAGGGPASWGGGQGLIGMRERVTSLGGSLLAGPTPDGGFEVVARLPLTTSDRGGL